MIRKWMLLLILPATLALTASALGQAEPSNSRDAKIVREVRHEILMLPHFGVFDNITFRVNGSIITLDGAVSKPILKSDAEGVVKHVDGVTRVVNNIEVLPPSSVDDQLRIELYHAIYGWPALEKYAMGVQKPIRIIVKGGHLWLEGVVDNQADKDAAALRANGVHGVFSVVNNLRVSPS